MALLAGDEEARARGTQKSVLERKAPPTFPLVIEMRERAAWVAHWTEDSVDALLQGQDPTVQLRRRLPGRQVSVEDLTYDSIADLGTGNASGAKPPRFESLSASGDGTPPSSTPYHISVRRSSALAEAINEML